MHRMKIERLSRIFRAVAHPKRIMIIKAMLKGFDTITKISDYTGLPYKTIERHILIMSHAGFIKQKRQGLTISYSLNNDATAEFHRTVLELIKKAK